MVTGFAFLSRLAQIAQPPTRFVFLGAGLRLGLPSHPASRRRSCLRLGVSTTSSSRGLSPPIDRPCRAYSRVAGGHFRSNAASLALRASRQPVRVTFGLRVVDCPGEYGGAPVDRGIATSPNPSQELR